MRPKMLPFVAFATVLVSLVLLNSCGNGPGLVNCPTCGTTTNGSVSIIDVIIVPEHNPTGEPGGPFNSFDISWTDTPTHRFYVSDRIGLDVVVVDTINNVAVNTIGGANGVSGGGVNASPCVPTGETIIPPLVDALGNFTRFACRTMNFAIPGFGANGLFGGFTGAQCCASRANGVNPLSAPDGLLVTPDGNTLFASNSSSTVMVFDLTCGGAPCTLSNPAPVIAAIPTGQSPDWDGKNGVAPCIVSASGRAFSDPTCGDLRADEMSYDSADKILLVANGDPGVPFVTLIDVSGVVNRTSNCAPIDPTKPYGVPLVPFGSPAVTFENVVGNASNAVNGPVNRPSCIIGQIYYDGFLDNPNVTVDAGPKGDGPCPNPSNFFDSLTTMGVPTGVSGFGNGVYVNGPDVPCHHAPVSPAGIGGSAFNPNTGHFLVSNSNASPTDLTVGNIDEIDPRIGNPNGPVVVNHFTVPNCMPSGVVQGPGNNFLVTCADHDGEAFPPNEYIIDGTSGGILTTITFVGGVDEAWFNPGDGRYYLAARDMPTGPVLGVIDAKSMLWLQNAPTNANSHSVSVDSSNNHVFVPSQAGGPCGTQRGNGCILVYAQQ